MLKRYVSVVSVSEKQYILKFMHNIFFFFYFGCGLQCGKFGERSRVSPCFGMPVPPAVSCFLSRPFHSLSASPFNGLGACRATRRREAPPHAKCIRIEARISATVSASVRSRTKAENTEEPHLAQRTMRESYLRRRCETRGDAEPK